MYITINTEKIMKKVFLSLALLALAAVGMLSISSCEKEEELQGTFIYYDEPFEKHCVKSDKEIKGYFKYSDSELPLFITGRIPSEFKPGDTAIVSAETKCVYRSVGPDVGCNFSLYKFKSVERI
jgi:hypothetical protein